MAFLMLDYLVGNVKEFGRFPRQVVLYVGEAAMKMEAGLWRAGYPARSESWASAS
jgi:hypothetical protein